MNTIDDQANDKLYEEKRHSVLQCEDCGSYDIEQSLYRRQNVDGTWPAEWIDDQEPKCASCGSYCVSQAFLSDRDIEEVTNNE